jgi:hypothetical protein
MYDCIAIFFGERTYDGMRFASRFSLHGNGVKGLS